MKLHYRKLTMNEHESVKKLISEDQELRDYLLSVLELESEKVTVAYQEEKILGLVQIEPEKNTSFVFVYVPVNYRKRGIGSALLQYGEAYIRDRKTKKIMTTYPVNNENSKRFANKYGYERLFSSAYLKRGEGTFSLEKVPARPYRDEDYDDAFKLSSVAFHEMRVRVGEFPDSKVGEPSEEMRNAWKQDIENRYIYEMDGEIAGYGYLEGNEIESISIRSDLQGKGIGKKFIQYLCNELYNRGNKEIFLWCVVGNKARKLYDYLGFEEVWESEFSVKSLNL